MHPSGVCERRWVPRGAKVQPGFLRGVRHGFAFWEQERKGLLGAEHTPREMPVVSCQRGL